MSGKGGSNNTVTQQTQTNPTALAAYNTAVGTGTNVASQPYPVYNSPLVAGFTPTQTAAFGNINNAAGLAQPYINQAANLVQASTSGINPASTVDQFMSPYTSNVVQGLQNVQNQQNAQQQNQLVSQAVGAGAFGGDRAQIAQSVLSGQQALGENPAISQALQQGYSQALNTGLSTQEANAWLNSQGAFALGNLGNEAQSTALSGASAQLQAGNQQQGQAQSQLSVPYQQFQQAQAYPYTISNFLMGLATGAGGAGSSSSTTSPGPSTLSQIAGLGTAGLGLYNAYNSSGLGNSSGALSSVYDPTGSSSYLSYLPTDTGWLPAQRGGRIGHYDDGGSVPLGLGLGPSQTSPGELSPLMMSGLGSGNPMVGGVANQLAQMPTEKLREMAARVPPGSQQGAMVQMMLRRRQMNPQTDPSLAQNPMQGLGGLPGMAPQQSAFGGAIHAASGASVGDDNFIPPDERGWSNLPGMKALRALGDYFSSEPTPDEQAARALDASGDMTGVGETGGTPTPPVGASDLSLPPSSDRENDTILAPSVGPPARTPTPTNQYNDTIPTPPVPPADLGQAPQTVAAAEPSQQAPGLGQGSSFLDRLTTGPSGALIAAGLGMLAGQSPHAAVNIGQGGLEGLKNLQQQKQLIAQMALKQQQEQWNHDYQLGRLQNQSASTDVRAQHWEDAKNIAYLKALQGVGRGAQEHFTYMPGEQDDGKGGVTKGIYRMPTSGSGQPTFIPNVVTQRAIDSDNRNNLARDKFNLSQDQLATANAMKASNQDIAGAKSIYAGAVASGKTITWSDALKQAQAGNAALSTRQAPAQNAPLPKPTVEGQYTPAQAKSLPKGAIFTGTDGNLYEVP